MANLLKKETDVDAFDLITSVLVRNFEKSLSIPIPRELINFRTVKGLR